MKMQLVDERLERVLFYTLEKSIKTYRQFAQRRLSEMDCDITIDQWLTLKTISDNPGLSQREIAHRVFKDQASVTRIIDALVHKGFLNRMSNEQDRRRFSLRLSEIGESVLVELDPVIKNNRNKALNGFTNEEVDALRLQLEKIINNCNT